MVLKRSSFLNRSGSLRSRKPIKKVGSRGLAWRETRSEKVASDIDDDGLIHCEDWKLGLKRCGIARRPRAMHLHHSKGRDGNLLTDKRYLVWLTEDCHNAAHGR